MPRRQLFPILYILVSVVLAFAMTWSLNHYRRYQPYAGLFSPDEGANRQFALQLDDVELRGRSGGHPQWSVHASRVTLLPDQNNLSIDSIERGVLMNNARPYLRFSARRAVYAIGSSPNTTGIVTVTGGIQIASVPASITLGAPIAIATASAIWNGYQALLTLPDSVSVDFGRTSSSPAVHILAQCASWNANARLFVCPGAVQTSIDYAGNAGPYLIESHNLDYNENTGVIQSSLPVTLSVPRLGAATCRPLLLDTHKRSVDFGAVHVVAQISSALLPTSDTPAPSASVDSASQGASAKPAEKASTNDTDNQVTVDAPQGGHWDDQDRILTVRGPVTFHQGDASMTTVGAVYDRKTDIAHALSPVTMTDPDTIVTGESGDVNFKKHIATLAGQIHIDVRPKPDKDAKTDDTADDSETKQPSVLTCDAIVYNYKAKFATTTGTVVIEQKHRTVTADKGTYDLKAHIAELTGNMVATSDDGKILKADSATVSTKKGDESIDVPHPTEIVIPVSPDDNPRSTK